MSSESTKATAEEEFICGYVIEFSDGGDPEGGILHQGTLEDCERVANMIPGVAYSGSRPVAQARIVIHERENQDVR